MKRALVVAITLLTFVATGSLWAGFQGPGSENLTTVAAAKKARDESYVTLTGNIVKQTKHEHYIFRDSTGEIEVEIETGKVIWLPAFMAVLRRSTMHRMNMVFGGKHWIRESEIL